MTESPEDTAGARLTLVSVGSDDDNSRSGQQAILATKLVAPPSTQPNVVRQSLLDRLDGFSGKLTVVVAPAGWGKTTLIRDWRQRHARSATAWLSLDPADNDPVRFWTYLISALQTAIPGCGATILSALAAQGSGVANTFLPSLMETIAEFSTPVVLVLDDYHVISDSRILEAVEFFVHHQPLTLHLVLATRTDPTLPMPRLRVRGEVNELRAADLRFTDTEAALLLNHVYGLPVSDPEVVALQHRTEGWAAGLCLAGLSLRNHPDRAGYISAFAGDDRQVVDYLITEVVDALAPQVRAFLVQTSILERLSAELCDAVIDSRGSQQLLEQIERSNLFVVPLDNKRQWYRYHHLFADLLRSELHRTNPALIPTLHRRASRWYAGTSAISDAVDHAIWAGDLVEAGELIAAHWNVCFSEGLVATVASWLDRLPPQMVTADARLCLARGWVARHTGNLDVVETWVHAAESAPARGPLRDGSSTLESSACLLRAGYRYMIGDLAGGEGPARRALELEVAGVPRWRAHALVTLGANLTWQGRSGEAQELLTQVVPLDQPPANNLAALWAHGCLAVIAVRNGDLDSAAQHIDLARQLATAHGLTEYPMGAAAALASAEVSRLRRRSDEAEASGHRGLELAQRGGARLETTYSHLTLAATLSPGQPELARAHFDEAGRILKTCADPGILTAIADEVEPVRGRGAPPDIVLRSMPEPLTKRERNVLRLLNSELSLREIAAELFVSYNTVKSQTRAVYRKLGVSTRAEAVAISKRRTLGPS
jgi:LuxR family maltose regulon positive regulatory protein